MKIPKNIEPLIDDGVVDEVLRQLKGGKEATVYLVRCGSELRCAKVYKKANNRSFRHATEYMEGRKVKNSRRGRAMHKGSRYGREEQESSWQNAEVDALYVLAAAGVRVPKAFGFYDGVLLMEVVLDADDNIAPRLADVSLEADLAVTYHNFLIGEVVRMLCAGIIHGDLSEYNILLSGEGPVIIDLPQAVSAAGNNQAARLLDRDVENLKIYFGQFAPQLLASEYAAEIWKLYKEGKLKPDTQLSGKFKHSTKAADVRGMLRELEEVREEHEEKRRKKDY